MSPLEKPKRRSWLEFHLQPPAENEREVLVRGMAHHEESATIDKMGDTLAQAYLKFGEMAKSANDEDIKNETKKEMDAAETKLDEEINQVTGNEATASAMGDLAERIKTFKK
jgi:hypothetical protein